MSERKDWGPALRGGGKTNMAVFQAVAELDPEFARAMAEAQAQLLAEYEAAEDEDERKALEEYHRECADWGIFG